MSDPNPRRPHWTTFAKGVKRPRGTMNKTEVAYAEHLEKRKWAGEVLWYSFEALTFKIAEGCRYTPDFTLMLLGGLVECHECKGFWADDARVKIKAAAEKFPFRFVAVKKLSKKAGGGWEEIVF